MGQLYSPTLLQGKAPQYDTRAFLSSVNGFRDSLKDYRNTLALERRQKRLDEQTAIQNKRADAQLAIQQANADRLQNKYDRGVAQDQALQDYAQQLNNYQSDVVTPEEADKIRQAYDANPNADVQSMVNAAQDKYNANTVEGDQARVNMLNQVAMPSGKYDPTKLLALQDRAISKPQGLLDTINANKAADALRKQKLIDQYSLARYKQSLKPDNGIVSMSYGTPGTKDYKVTNVPIRHLKDMQEMGWILGKAVNSGKTNGYGLNHISKKGKSFSFTKDKTTNGRLNEQLIGVANHYNVDPKRIQSALNTAKEDQNNFLWWRDAADALGFDTEPSKQDVLSRIPSGYVNSNGDTVSIADQEGYLKDAGVSIFKDITTGKYINKDIATGEVLTQADVQKRIKALSISAKKPTTSSSDTNDTNASTSIPPTSIKDDTEPPSQLKIDAVNYINKLRNPDSKEFKDDINNVIDIISGGGLKRTAKPVVKKVITKAEQFIDDLLKRKTISGQGVMKTTGSKVSANGEELKKQFLQQVSDEVAILLSKTGKSTKDITRLKEIANRFPSMKQDILKYLYK